MADGTTLIPFDDGKGWDAGVGGAVGAALGSWFFNGGNGFWGGNRGNVPGQIAADTLVVDQLSNIANQISGVNTTMLESQASQNQSLCAGFSGVNNSIMQTAAQTQQGLCQGFNNLNSTVQNTSSQARFDTLSGVNALQRAIDSCCCTTNNNITKSFGDLALENCQNTGRVVNAITSEGAATRALINSNYINDLQSQLCDAKSRIGALESQQYTSGLINAQSAVFDQKLANAVATIITHIPKSSTTPTA